VSRGNGSFIARIASEHSTSRQTARQVASLIYESAQSLRDFRLQIQHAAVDRDEQVRKATAAIDTITDSRLRRADLAMGQERLDELNEGLANLRRENDRGQSVPRSACPPVAVTFGY